MLISESDMLGGAERGTTKLLTSRIKFLTAPQSHITTPIGVYITHPQGAYHEFRKEFYITAHSAYITRRKALYHERKAFYITSLCLVRQTTLSTCPVIGNKSNGKTTLAS